MDPTENQANDSAEWDEVGLDFLSDKGVESEKKTEEQRTIDEQTKSEEGSEETGTQEGDPAKKEPDEKSGASNDPQKGVGTEGEGGKEGEEKLPVQPEKQTDSDPDAAERTQRRAQLELDADRKELAKDIKEKMFSDVPDKLLDAEGREIRNPQDVTQYKNPVTGKNFTLEEGAQWLMLAQRGVEEKQAEAQKEIDRITDVNLTIKEEAQEVMERFGKLLEGNPKLRKQVWEDYKNTLEISPDGEVITNAKLSMKSFYNTVLTPHLAYAVSKQQAAKEKADAEEQAKKEADAKKVAEAKEQSKSDREDVFSTRTKGHEGMDPEEKEWAEVGKEYFEG